MKNNHPIPHNHFKKTALRYRTTFHEKARAIKQQQVKEEKRSRSYPAQVEKLRPIVRCPTLRYKTRERLGRGFTPEECEAAGHDYRELRTLGVSIDLRRRNHNKEAFDQNVERIVKYMSKLVIFKDRQEARKSGVKQHKGKIMPVEKKKPVVESVKICEIESKVWAAEKVKQLIDETKYKRVK